MANRIYDIPFPPTWPDGRPFDPANDHEARLLLDRQVKKWRQEQPDRADYAIDSIDMDRHQVTLRRPQTISSIETEDGRKKIRLDDRNRVPSRGRSICSTWESRFDGWKIVRIDFYAGYAWMERLDDEQVSARAILSKALRLDPWKIRVDHTAEHGWRIELDRDVVYSVDQDKALQTAVETRGVGAPGWWFDADPSKGVIIIHPGSLPTFDKTYGFPFGLLGRSDWRDRRTFAVRLPDHGGEKADPLVLDWRKSPFLIVGGEGGTGKSVAINNLLAGEIAAGVNLAIIDTSNKAGDYYWARPWVTPGYWGCESDVQADGVLERLCHDMEQGERGRAWKRNGWQSWYDIPDWAKREYPIFTIIVDEFSTLVDSAQKVKTPPNPERTLPPIYESMFHGYVADRIKYCVLRILRTARAQGYRLILISQTINDKSGLGPTVRDLFGHRMVMGANPSKSMVEGTFHDPSTVPAVPKNILDDGAGTGVGRSELSGDRARVFKTYWAGDDGLTDTQMFGRRMIDVRGLPDDVDRDRYLDTLREHKGDDPIDVEYMRRLTDRIALPYEEALSMDPVLRVMKDGWDESLMHFGGDSGEKDDGDAAPKPRVKPDASTGPVSGVDLGPAMDLARVMEGRS